MKFDISFRIFFIKQTFIPFHVRLDYTTNNFRQTVDLMSNKCCVTHFINYVELSINSPTVLLENNPSSNSGAPVFGPVHLAFLLILSTQYIQVEIKI